MKLKLMDYINWFFKRGKCYYKIEMMYVDDGILVCEAGELCNELKLWLVKHRIAEAED